MRLLPTPTSVTWGDGDFLLPNPLPIAGGGRAAENLAERLLVAAGVTSVRLDDGAAPVRFTVDASLAPEEYRLDVSADGVDIVAADDAGAGWAVQTLLQLLPPAVHGPGPMEPTDLRVPFVQIADRPRFGWRGTMIDVARHFLPLEGLLRHLDLMALHKLNVLHLHLTDDQGWRLPVAAYPKLTEVAAWRPGTVPGHQPPPDANDCDDVAHHDGRPHGGSWSADDIRRLVARAAQLGITVVPEIDMPGHMEAAIAAYPWLGACDHVEHPRTCWGISEHVLRLSERTLQFCRDVLDAAMDLFPDSPIHIGGDECPGTEWFADAESRATMAAAGATTAAEAQAWFEAQICAHVERAGRRVVAWDDVLDGGAPTSVIVTAWRDVDAITRAVEAGHDVLACPFEHTYLDYSASDHPDEPLTIGGPRPQEQVAQLSAVLDQVAHLDAPGRVLGGQAQLWTEYVHTWPAAEYLLWPRASAIAQQLWAGTPGDTGSVPALGRHLARLTSTGVNWRRPPLNDGAHG